MKSFTATIITVSPIKSIEHLQDFMTSTFAKLGITITHFHDTIYQHIFAHVKFDFHIEHDDESVAVQLIKQLQIAPVEINQWTMTLG
jgi:hypothetical protein